MVFSFRYHGFGLTVGHPGRNIWEEVGSARLTGQPYTWISLSFREDFSIILQGNITGEER